MLKESTYNLCLLYASGSDTGFGVIGLQIDETLILADKTIVSTKEDQLIEAKLLAKKRERLTETTPIKFNGGLIRREPDSVLLSQERQCNGLCLMNLDLTDLTST